MILERVIFLASLIVVCIDLRFVCGMCVKVELKPFRKQGSFLITLYDQQACPKGFTNVFVITVEPLPQKQTFI